MFKTLRSFVERFRKVALSIRELSLEVALHQLITALKPRPFSNSLCKNPAGSMDELRQRATIEEGEQTRGCATDRGGTTARVTPKKTKRVPKAIKVLPIHAFDIQKDESPTRGSGSRSYTTIQNDPHSSQHKPNLPLSISPKFQLYDRGVRCIKR